MRGSEDHIGQVLKITTQQGKQYNFEIVKNFDYLGMTLTNRKEENEEQ